MSAVTVVRSCGDRSLGIDAERRAPLPDEVDSIICTARELAWCRKLAADRVPWESVIFSAKESVFKAWFPLTRAWLGYLEADIVLGPLDARSGGFRVVALRSEAAGPRPQRFVGHYVLNGNLIGTTAVVR